MNFLLYFVVNQIIFKVLHITDKIYDLETCSNGCRQRETVKRCGCASPRYNKADNDSWCTPTKANLDCLHGLKGDQANLLSPNLNSLTECRCDPSCSETTFQTTASLSKFPSKNYFVVTENKHGVVGNCNNHTNTIFNKVSSITSRSTSFVLFIQFFKGSTSMINDLGGQAGLWLGLSVISIVEDVENVKWELDEADKRDKFVPKNILNEENK
uniref:Apple domain-containing protein n=1 Tax=Heterorhabditis bacteriophora TaxID=37862 RepID=A0A1I7X0H9_HETBA